MPIASALELSAEDALEPDALRALATRLRRGESLAEAAACFPEAFPSWQVALLRVGDKTGRFDQALGIIAEILEVRRAFWLGLLARLALPLFLLHAGPLILSVPLWVSRGFGAYLSAVCRALLPLDLAIVLFWWQWPRLRDTALFARFARFDLKHRFCVVLSALVGAGIALDEAVALAAAAVGREVPEHLARDGTLVDRLAALDVLSGAELGALRVAEFSGEVDTELALLAGRIREDWAAALKSA